MFPQTNRIILPLCIATVLLLLLVGSVQCDVADYRGHSVYRIAIRTEEQLEILERLEGNGAIDVWSESRTVGAHFDVRISPHLKNVIHRVLFEEAGATYVPLIEDLGVLIDEERLMLSQIPAFTGVIGGGSNSLRTGTDDFFAKYRTVDEFALFLDTLHNQYPELTELFSIGKSLEGRQIVGIKIRGHSNAQRKSLLFNGGQHAREWISPMVTAYIAHQLLTRYQTDPQVKNLVDNLEWHIVPIVNPDGYLFTWSGDRLWRKNRRVNPSTSCRGVDLNRNWNYKWNATGGSSTNPCSETYRGPSPFSEPESAAIGYYAGNMTNLRGYIDFHSYSQLWMRPWGYTADAPKDEPIMKAVGDACSAAIERVHGKKYQSGRISIIIYPASGSSVDYVYGKTGAISFGVELRDTGRFGFLLPPDQIVPTGEENWAAAVMTLGMHILEEK